MINQDIEKLCEGWRSFWQRENHNRPIMFVTAPKEGAVRREVAAPASIEERWLNMEYVIENARAGFECTYFGGEAFPRLNPNLGPDIMGAVCGGCDIVYGERTSWAVPKVKDFRDFPPIKFDENNPYWKKIRDMTKAAVDDARGDYMVGITDIHPGADGLVSLRGPEEVCLDLMDCPDEIIRRMDEMTAAMKEVYSRLYAILQTKQTGNTCWLGPWNPDGNWYVPSSDFCCLIDNAHFEKFIAPTLEKEFDFFDKTLFHLDGPGALHHLDRLLQFEKMGGIQWVPGDGAAPCVEWMPVYKKIQAAGKNIIANIRPQDVEIFCSELEPEGLMLGFGAHTEQEAKDCVALAEKITASKRKKY